MELLRSKDFDLKDAFVGLDDFLFKAFEPTIVSSTSSVLKRDIDNCFSDVKANITWPYVLVSLCGMKATSEMSMGYVLEAMNTFEVVIRKPQYISLGLSNLTQKKINAAVSRFLDEWTRLKSIMITRNQRILSDTCNSIKYLNYDEVFKDIRFSVFMTQKGNPYLWRCVTEETVNDTWILGKIGAENKQVPELCSYISIAYARLNEIKETKTKLREYIQKLLEIEMIKIVHYDFVFRCKRVLGFSSEVVKVVLEIFKTKDELKDFISSHLKGFVSYKGDETISNVKRPSFRLSSTSTPDTRKLQFNGYESENKERIAKYFVLVVYNHMDSIISKNAPLLVDFKTESSHAAEIVDQILLHRDEIKEEIRAIQESNIDEASFKRFISSQVDSYGSSRVIDAIHNFIFEHDMIKTLFQTVKENRDFMMFHKDQHMKSDSSKITPNTEEKEAAETVNKTEGSLKCLVEALDFKGFSVDLGVEDITKIKLGINKHSKKLNETKDVDVQALNHLRKNLIEEVDKIDIENLQIKRFEDCCPLIKIMIKMHLGMNAIEYVRFVTNKEKKKDIKREEEEEKEGPEQDPDPEPELEPVPKEKRHKRKAKTKEKPKPKKKKKKASSEDSELDNM